MTLLHKGQPRKRSFGLRPGRFAVTLHQRGIMPHQQRPQTIIQTICAIKHKRRKQMFNADETKIIIEALDLALASNKRMQNSKPKFAMVFSQIETEINAVKAKLLAPTNFKNK
jgi:hypothetical protein